MSGYVCRHGACDRSFNSVNGRIAHEARGHLDPAVLFWAKVDKTSTCWLWTGARHPLGYGHVRYGNRTSAAHRVAWELINGPIPEGLTLDHLCRVPACVRPDHLEPVTHRENVRRGI